MKIINKVSLMLLCIAAISCSNMINDQKGYAPGQVTLTALSTGTDFITMTWTDPSDSALEYEVVTCNSTETRVEKGVCTCTVSGLSSGTDYAVGITSSSSAGRSSEALTFSATTTSSGTRTYYLIYTAEDMYNVRNDLTGYYLLMADISLSDYSNWSPIGSDSNAFSGGFDGNNHVISGLTINSTSSNYQGLFGCSNGPIKNVGLKNVSVSGSNYVGGLVGVYYGDISNSYATGAVSGSNYVGGLVGRSYGGDISNSYTKGTVSGSYYVGGLVGLSYCEISNCYTTGTVSGNAQYVGGLVGYSNGDISNSYATGTVSGSYFVGGLVGWSNEDISNSYATGAISGSYYVGGLAGYAGSTTFCYYDGTTTGYYASLSGSVTWEDVGTAMTTAQMKLQDSATVCGTGIYVDWDFSTVWGISGSINSGYPYLVDNAPE